MVCNVVKSFFKATIPVFIILLYFFCAGLSFGYMSKDCDEERKDCSHHYIAAVFWPVTVPATFGYRLLKTKGESNETCLRNNN